MGCDLWDMKCFKNIRQSEYNEACVVNCLMWDLCGHILPFKQNHKVPVWWTSVLIQPGLWPAHALGMPPPPPRGYYSWCGTCLLLPFDCQQCGFSNNKTTMLTYIKFWTSFFLYKLFRINSFTKHQSNTITNIILKLNHLVCNKI